MKELNITREEQDLKSEIKSIFDSIQKIITDIPDKLNEQVNKLFQLRSEIYEDLNQLQHKSLLLTATRYLQKEFPQINRWFWHPEQTSKPDEADLTGYIDDKIIVSAEATTSAKPIGAIDAQMQKTLCSLNKKEGEHFYFVQTTKMFDRAKIKIANNNWNIVPKQM